jgi:uncharacterized protein YneF (UPF0154 family)
MKLEWQEWVALIVALILLFGPAIGFWWAGHIHEKHNKNNEKQQTQEYYVATTDADDED